jgi:ABC-2 type transport system permease protein
VAAIDNTETFNLRHRPDSMAELTPLIESGRVSAAFVIPEGYGSAVSGGGEAQLQVVVDGSEPAAADMAIESAEGLVATLASRTELLPASTGGDGLSVVDTSVIVRFNEQLKESNYTVPSEMGFMLSAITMMIASLGIARERELGTLEQINVSPIRPVELVIGKAIPAIILSYILFLFMLAISIVGFGVPMRGSWPLLLVIAAFYLFVELGWGLMASAVSRTQLQALLLVFVLVMVEIVFSGYAFPVENMPAGLQAVANVFPIKHWLLILRSIMLKDAGPSAYWRELVSLAVLGTMIMSGAVLVLRRQQTV